MNDDSFLENEIRRLRPGPLPEDLRMRMTSEPTPMKHTPLKRVVPWVVAGALAAAACIAIVLNPPSSTEKIADENTAPPEPLSIVEQESTLLESRTIEIREHNGRMWELVDQEWRDDTVAICSTTSVRVQSTVIRPETVWLPVEFQ